ncbi:MAG: deoxyhypusine synthase [Candidatus Heimdallarchaeota archaeon]|nr:deoxyhypusine synthase [Candidatus Heimdallarchaeota archaeon]
MKSKNNKHPRVNPIDIKDKDSITELIAEFHSSGVFGPGRIAKAVDIYTEMIKQKSTVFLGIAGALVPGGMRKILTDMIKEGMVQVIVSTGANVTHDLIEAFGGKHIRQVPYKSDQELREKSIDRIYDAFVADESFIKLEDNLQPIFKEIWENTKDETNTLVISTRRLMQLIGEKLEDDNSFVKAAYDHKVPIYVPALADSILGLQLWLFSQMNRTLIDDMDDLGSIQRLAWDSEKAGAFFLGGGVPKNYIFQSRLMSPKTFDYAIQITMDRVETGGLSGASLEEAISWGKVTSESRMVNVVSDITIALPLIFQATLSNLKRDD